MSGQQASEPRRRQRLTRLGFHFLFVGAFAMLGGALRGFNLLLVLAGLLVGALIMQWRWSRRSIEATDIQRRLPDDTFAGRSFRVRYLLQNSSRFMPVWMIRVEDRIQSVSQSQRATAVCGVGVIPAGRSVLSTCDCLILRRGRYRFGPIQLITTFPFSLFRSWKTVESQIELHIFPQILPLRSRWRQRLTSRTGGVSTTARRNGPAEGEFFGLREWQTGDSPKWIHWRTTARINELAVRQFEQQRRFDTCILIDAYATDDEQARSTVESAISLGATLLIHLVGSPSNQVALAVAGESSDAVIGGGSDLGKRRMLEILADLIPTTSPDLTDAASSAMRMVGYTQDMIVVSSRSMADAKREDASVMEAFAPWLRRGSLRWIDVSTELDRWARVDAADSVELKSDSASERPPPSIRRSAEMSKSTPVGPSAESERISLRLKFYFAALTCLGGAVLSAGTETSSIPVIAIFFGLFGFVFVDWLEFFALPPIAAYAAMGLAALFCVSDFTDFEEPGNHQMIAVAQLLVFVQAILMLQRKSRRIFEQLAVFCLLELIVAAVFNNAISYGLLLLPMAAIAAWALSLLAATTATEGLDRSGQLDDEPSKSAGDDSGLISVSAPESLQSLSASALRLPRVAFVTLAPAVLLVGAIFFYALPRTTDAARVQNRGNALVGFSDELRLEQIGQMMQSSDPALRMYATDRATGKPYVIVGGVYLRGKVLSEYTPRLSGDRNTAIWGSAPAGLLSEPQQLPEQFFPARASDKNFYDEVDVTVRCESSRSNALFTTAPYHRVKNQPEVIHLSELWTISRASQKDGVYPRLEYRFGTHAFRSGIQSALTTYRGVGDPALGMLSIEGIDDRYRSVQENSRLRHEQEYLEELLEFDPDAMPTATALASELIHDASGKRRSDFEIAKAMERHLVTPGRYIYTLNLDAESVPGLDPIEQFLSIDRRGHCQYFASALAMMLRSQGIPARIVAGYHTDEYNDLGNHYVARQLHAHAWVEALIPVDQLGANQPLYGQAPADKYWMRLDPTPAAGRVQEASGGVGQVLDMAQNMWDDYVVDMDASKQDKALIGGGSNPMNRSYKQLVDWLSTTISRVRAGELGGGSLASGNVFSWQAAVLGCGIALAMVILLRIRPPAWIRRRLRKREQLVVAKPSIAFYAETLEQMERIGVVRESGQTPAELARASKLEDGGAQSAGILKPLQFLTAAFYEQRFGEPFHANDQDASFEEGPVLEKSPSIEHAQQREEDPSQGRLDEALADLTRGVESMLKHQSNAEHTT